MITEQETFGDSRRFPSFPRGEWSDIPESDWNDYGWQLRHRLSSLRDLETRLNLSDEERAGILFATHSRLAVSITPQFFTLIDRDDPLCPIRRQVVPHIDEALDDDDEMVDPCGEDADMPIPGLVHRYPDRVLMIVTDRCSCYCRHCTRSRGVSGVGSDHLHLDWEPALNYLRQHTEVRDVLLSGGDPLLLSDERLDYLLGALRAIPHIELLRIGSRTPIFMPQRITSSLCAILRKHAPLFLSIHTNHPRELCAEVKIGLDKLVDAGIPLGNQTVLLRGINDTAEIQMELVHQLLMCRVKPYYLYQCDLIKGSSHFRTPLQTGIDIIQHLRGYTSGYAVPQYVIDGPGGGGKIPINPDYITKRTTQKTFLKNYLGYPYSYPEPRIHSDAERQAQMQSIFDQWG
ncbi:MAG: KamA family radical SAM protein [Akkermansia sp.]